MRRIPRFMLAAVALGVIAGSPIYFVAQTSVPSSNSSMPSPGQASKFQFSPGALLRAELDKTIDAKNAKAGDEVVVKLTDDLKWNGEVLAPAGSNILGHITEATPHRGGSPSTLGIAFDKLLLKDGSDIAFKAIIQAIGFPEAAMGSDQAIAGGQPASRGAAPGQVGGPGGTMGQPSAYPGQRMPGATAAASPVKLSPNARGVVGIAGVSLSIGAAGDSVISSSKHNVKIVNRAQMILCVQ